METGKQIRQHKNSTAESFVSLSLGLWSVALIGYLTSGISWETYFLIVVGAMSTLFGIYLILPWDWKQKQFLKYLEIHQAIKVTKSLGWFIVLAIFSVRLIQTKVGWLIVTGLIIAIVAYAVFLVSLLRMGKDNKENDKKVPAEENHKARQDNKMAASHEEVAEELLFKLYEIALKEARHHDKLFTAVWTPGIVLIGILLTASSLFLRQTTLTSKSIVVWTIIGLGALVLFCFYWSICRHASEAHRCRDICRNIEDILAGKIPKETIKLDSLLVIGNVKEMRVPWDKDVYSPLVDPVWRLFYPVMLMAVWVAVSLAVAGYIG